MSYSSLTDAKRVTQQYLTRYAEVEVESIARLDNETRYRHCLVIPAYNELIESMLYSRPALLAAPNTLVIIVVNRPDTDSDLKPSELFYQGLTKNKVKIFENKNLAAFHDTSLDVSFLLVDRFRRHPIPAKQGVGLARKIGCDIALALYNQGNLGSSWIHTSDCDTQLPANYFLSTNTLTENSAAVYPFRHQALSNNSQAQLVATQQYEAALHYYVERLHYAGSPYAFHTIGSCMAINSEDYARVRGFPKRAAGEDFYLLNKLSKLRPVHTLAHPLLIIDSRQSARTPFGTGRAVSQIMSLESGQPYCYYNPKSFTALKELLQAIDQLPAYYGRFEQWLSLLPQNTQEALTHFNIGELFKHLNKHIKEKHCIRHAHHWFDAFKTLKFIRFMQAYYPDTPLDMQRSHAVL